jgi:hypothetical protein
MHPRHLLASCSSTDTDRICSPRDRYRACSSCNVGMATMQSMHQVAHTSISVTRPASAASVIAGLPASSASTVKAGTARPGCSTRL